MKWGYIDKNESQSNKVLIEDEMMNTNLVDGVSIEDGKTKLNVN